MKNFKMSFGPTKGVLRLPDWMIGLDILSRYPTQMSQWSALNCSVTEGWLYDDVIEDTATSTHQIQRSPTYVAGRTYRFSVDVEDVGSRNVLLIFPGGAFGSATTARFDLTAGTATAVANTPTVSIEDLGSGRYRCHMTKAATVSTSGATAVRILQGTTASYAGDGTSGLRIYGAVVYDVT